MITVIIRDDDGKEYSIQELMDAAAKVNGKRTPRKRPTLEEVKAYVHERGNKIDAEQFYDHYQANGWSQGRGKAIKDWQAAVRSWEKNDFARARQETLAIEENNKPKPYTMSGNAARYRLIHDHGMNHAREWSDSQCLEALAQVVRAERGV